MTMNERLAQTGASLGDLIDKGGSRFRIGRSGAAALLAALAALAAAGLVFAVMLEDVVGHDGMALRDSGFDQAIADHRTPWLLETARQVTNVGSIGVLGLLAIVIAGAFWLRGLKIAESVAPVVSLGAAAVCAAVLKGLVGRSRPDVPLRLLNETEPSFPSGHATDSTALFVSVALVLAVVVLRRPLARLAVLVVGFTVPALIGLSRLELGVHWPSDVIAGWALGTVAAVGVTTTLILVGRLADTTGPDRTGLAWRAVHLLGSHRPVRARTPGLDAGTSRGSRLAPS